MSGWVSGKETSIAIDTIKQEVGNQNKHLARVVEGSKAVVLLSEAIAVKEFDNKNEFKDKIEDRIIELADTATTPLHDYEKIEFEESIEKKCCLPKKPKLSPEQATSIKAFLKEEGMKVDLPSDKSYKYDILNPLQEAPLEPVKSWTERKELKKKELALQRAKKAEAKHVSRFRDVPSVKKNIDSFEVELVSKRVKEAIHENYYMNKDQYKKIKSVRKEAILDLLSETGYLTRLMSQYFGPVKKQMTRKISNQLIRMSNAYDDLNIPFTDSFWYNNNWVWDSVVRYKYSMDIEIINIDISKRKKCNSIIDSINKFKNELEFKDSNSYNILDRMINNHLKCTISTINNTNVNTVKGVFVKNMPKACQRKKIFKIKGRLIDYVPIYIKTYSTTNKQGRWRYKFKNLTLNPYISDAEHCDWVLFDILTDVHEVGPTLFDIDGHSTTLLCIPFQTGVIRYASIDNCLLMVSNRIRFIMYRHLINDFSFIYVAPFSWVNLVINEMEWSNKPKLSNRVALRSTLGYYSKCEIPKIFRTDQVFINDNILLDCEQFLNNELVYQLINFGNQVSKLLIYGIIIYLHCISDELKWILKLSGLLDSKNDNEYIELGKIISDKAKTLQHYCDIDLRPIFEVHTIVNRINIPIDWEKEYLHRTSPNLAQISPDYTYKEAKKIFARGRLVTKGHRQYRRYDWESFWKDRLEWGTTGSFFSHLDTDKEVMKNFSKDFKNKFMYFIGLNNEVKLQNFLNRDQSLHATTSIKYEWTKERAIYGCDVTNYTITHFVMQNCEELLAKDIALGPNADLKIAKHKIEYILADKVPFCLDFEDFNSQHSIGNMKAVLCAYIDTWQDRMSSDQLLAAQWLVDSIEHQYVHDNIGLKKIYKCKGTLLSGWRLTSFINSILNQVYFKYAQGILQREHVSIHSGDDIMAGISSLREVQVIYRNCKKVNIRLSPLKCFVGSVAEFLRIDHHSKSHGQYLPRGIATFVAGKIESKPAFNIRDVISALLDRGSQIVNRGGKREIIINIIRSQIIHQSKSMGIEPQRSFDLLTTNRIQGGLSDLACIKGFRISLSIDSSKLSYEEKVALPKIQPGVYCYVKKCLERFPKFKNMTGILANRVQEKINLSFARIPNKLSYNKIDDTQLNFDKRIEPHKGKYKEYVKQLPEYGKIRLIGCIVESLAAISRTELIVAMMARSEDPIRCLEITTM